MLRRTSPAVQFSPSHRALMMRTSRPLLGSGMHSSDRAKAAWDEMPIALFNTNKKVSKAWDWKCRYELGLRNDNGRTKLSWVGTYVVSVCFVLCFLDFGYLPFYFPLFWAPPEHMNAENGRATSLKWGWDVYCADGKFVRPFFHLTPPMYTMKVEDLE